jgi:hypothetical protein
VVGSFRLGQPDKIIVFGGHPARVTGRHPGREARTAKGI